MELTDEKKLELIDLIISKDFENEESDRALALLYSKKYDERAQSAIEYVAVGIVAAIRQLGPVIDCATLAKSGQFDLSYMQIVGEEALRQAGLEE